MHDRTWLVAHDFSPSADAAMELACSELSALGSGRVILVHVLAMPYVPVHVPGLAPDAAIPRTLELSTLLEKDLTEALEKLANDAKKLWPRVHIETHVLAGAPFEAVLTAIESFDVDRLVVGSHGRTGLKHLVLGSVSARLARLSPVPVLVVKAKEETKEDAKKAAAESAA